MFGTALYLPYFVVISEAIWRRWQTMIEFWSEFCELIRDLIRFKWLKSFIIEDKKGTSCRKPRESARTARTTANIARVSELICSQDTQDDDPSTSKSEIQRQKGIYRSTVRRIAKIWSDVQDLNFLLASYWKNDELCYVTIYIM